ncbi:preprotein translocase subunit YajC [Leifsonia xyli subsp. xyli]|uniref:Preprotein translocase, YajC subunit n=2 Tax=Leifsonia xyli subsp. xyli TaxID=59736 RepID=Q6AFB3_LEIXX|nr:preprotein translocase subunit YajC [Leifsonia xyli]AAT88932.1 preprotein translocase, YajC subunit [Leifsonia xyli subsp. xyli str. CTCB07]ODA90418.1 preprotein translocase subunit YajC [Leifsonia xyli subsp. xyli]
MIDPLTIVMVVILAALVFFMFRNSRKRSKEQAETRSKMVPGVEIMTNFGLYGTLLSVDEDDNTALIETSPGQVVKVHRQVLARVIEPKDAVVAEDAATPEIGLNTDTAIRHDAPEFGERIEESSPKPGAKSDD